MAVRGASAEWKGTLKEGAGTMRLGSGAFEGPYTFVSRFESGAGTNPEELIGAAHAGCFSMALAAALGRAGHSPTSIKTSANVHLGTSDAGPTITQIDLDVEGVVPGIDAAAFQQFAEGAKTGCVVSRALAGVKTINLKATLK
jgi:lipoyl-dependent peroxiredoxin